MPSSKKLKNKTVATLQYKGFLYHEEYCYDDCCLEYEGYCLTSRRLNEKDWDTEVCGDCENEDKRSIITGIWDGQKYVNGDINYNQIDNIIYSLIKKAIGYEPIQGEYIDVKIRCDVSTADTIILG